MHQQKQWQRFLVRVNNYNNQSKIYTNTTKHLNITTVKWVFICGKHCTIISLSRIMKISFSIYINKLLLIYWSLIWLCCGFCTKFITKKIKIKNFLHDNGEQLVELISMLETDKLIDIIFFFLSHLLFRARSPIFLKWYIVLIRIWVKYNKF